MSTTIAPSTAVAMIKGTMLKEARVPQAPSLVDMLAEKETSNLLTERYSFVERAPQLRLLKDELEVEQLGDAEYSIDNNVYKVGLKIPRLSLRVDQLRILTKRARDMVRVARRFPNKLMSQIIEGGVSTAGFDGASFYSANHPHSSGVNQSNILAGSGIANVDQLRTDLGLVLRMLAEHLAENGEPHVENLGKVILEVPWRISGLMDEAVNAAVVAQTSNMRFRRRNIEIIENNRVLDTTDWRAHHVDGEGGRPFIWQELDPIDWQVLGPGSDYWVEHDAMLATIRWAGNGGYGHHGNSVLVQNTGT